MRDQLRGGTLVSVTEAEANMDVIAHHSREHLLGVFRREKRAKVARRLQVVLGAMEGLTADAVGVQVQLSDRAVHHWLKRYNTQGLPGLEDKPGRGRKPALTPEQEQQFKARIDARATPADGVCALRGEDARKILAKEFGVIRKLQATYNLLHKVGLVPLQPRPQHPDADPAAQEAFKKKRRTSLPKSPRSTRTSKSKSGLKTKPASVKKGR